MADIKERGLCKSTDLFLPPEDGGSKGILSGGSVIVGLKLSVCSVSHEINLFRTIRFYRLVQHGTEGRGFGLFMAALP